MEAQRRAVIGQVTQQKPDWSPALLSLYGLSTVSLACPQQAGLLCAPEEAPLAGGSRKLIISLDRLFLLPPVLLGVEVLGLGHGFRGCRILDPLGLGRSSCTPRLHRVSVFSLQMSGDNIGDDDEASKKRKSKNMYVVRPVVFSLMLGGGQGFLRPSSSSA